MLALAVATFSAVHVLAGEAPPPDNYIVDVWQVEQGLPGNSVNSIVQTRDGYLWFGTFNGLARFDGVRFKVFDSSIPGLESERVLHLFVDRESALWISMEQGQLARYARGRFTAFHREDGWPMEECLPRGMAVERSGRFFFSPKGICFGLTGSAFGLCRLKLKRRIRWRLLQMTPRDGHGWGSYKRWAVSRRTNGAASLTSRRRDKLWIRPWNMACA